MPAHLACRNRKPEHVLMTSLRGIKTARRAIENNRLLGSQVSSKAREPVTDSYRGDIQKKYPSIVGYFSGACTELVEVRPKRLELLTFPV